MTQEFRESCSFKQLYQSLFPRAPEDSLSNYAHLRTLVSRKYSSCDTQIDVARSLLGPTSRESHGGRQVVLKSVAISSRQAPKRALREAAIHRALSLSWTPQARVLPLLSHFISHILPGEDEEHQVAEESGDSGGSTFKHGRRTSTTTSKKSIFLVLVFPYLERGNLFDFVAQRSGRKRWKRGVSEEELRWIIVEMALALQRCHERGIVHRDVKANNILIDTRQRTAVLRLADFGLSTWIDEQASRSEDAIHEEQGDSTLCGTWDHLSPETATQRRTGPASDVWSLGCVCVWLLTGTTPFTTADDGGHHRIVDRIAVGDWEAVRAKLPVNLSYECVDMLEGMLQVDIGERSTISRILKHPFLKPELPRRAIVECDTARKVRRSKMRPIEPKASTPLRRRATDIPSRKDPILQPCSASAEKNCVHDSNTSTSLRSAMEKFQWQLNHRDGRNADGRLRKTPFGLIKQPLSIPTPRSRPMSYKTRMMTQPAHMKKNESSTQQVFEQDTTRLELMKDTAESGPRKEHSCATKDSWGGGFGTRGITPLRQRREDGGRMIIDTDGNVIIIGAVDKPSVDQRNYTFVIDQTGQYVTDCRGMVPKVHKISDGLDGSLEDIYKEAQHWLNRVRARSVVAAFSLSPTSTALESKDKPSLPAAKCLIRANSDYIVLWRGKFGAHEGYIEVDVQRKAGTMVLITFHRTSSSSKEATDADSERQTFEKRCTLPITCTSSRVWTCSVLQDDKVGEVPQREKLAAKKALDCARTVDGIFGSLPWAQTADHV